jgi:hypothetical protein
MKARDIIHGWPRGRSTSAPAKWLWAWPWRLDQDDIRNFEYHEGLVSKTEMKRKLPWVAYDGSRLAWCPNCKRRHRVQESFYAKHCFCPKVNSYFRVQERQARAGRK